MCDILVATPKATRGNVMLFAKNSDRDPNEAQILELIPRKKHEEASVKLTYLEFPQVRETYSIIISRPWWIWGAEMGVNEFGLAIGNTAVFGREGVLEKGILGMDILRLALERSRNAGEALRFVTEIIDKQGGNASYEHRLLYSNSFIIADKSEAWVLESVGRHYTAKRITDVYSISNALTIGSEWDLASDSVERLARRQGFNFARHFSDKFYTFFAHGRDRRAYTYSRLKEREGEITVEYMMSILRSHSFEPYRPHKGSMRDICMHYGGITRPSQTASSQVSELGENGIHWFTGTSLPCLSIFKPLTFNTSLPDLGERPTNMYNPNNYWWRVELFHRRFQTNYSHISQFSMERDEVQRTVLEAVEEFRSGLDLSKPLKLAFEKERELIDRWDAMIAPAGLPFLYSVRWRTVNRRAQLSI
ncbi:MAG: C69 family dipeptidase [Nitrososphaerota archaeon]